MNDTLQYNNFRADCKAHTRVPGALTVVHQRSLNRVREGIDSLKLRVPVVGVHRPEMWEGGTRHNGGTGVVTRDLWSYPVERHEDFRMKLSPDQEVLVVEFDASVFRSDNLIPITPERLRDEVAPGLAEWLRYQGVEGDVEAGEVVRLDPVRDLCLSEPVGKYVEALGHRLQPGRSWRRVHGEAGSYRWEARRSSRRQRAARRVIRVYDKGRQLGEPGINVLRVEVSFNEKQGVQDGLGSRERTWTLGDLLDDSSLVPSAFVRVMEPALPEGARVAGDMGSLEVDCEGLVKAVGRSRPGLEKACAALVFSDPQLRERLLSVWEAHAGGGSKGRSAKHKLKGDLEGASDALCHFGTGMGDEAYAMVRGLLLDSPRCMTP